MSEEQHRAPATQMQGTSADGTEGEPQVTPIAPALASAPALADDQHLATPRSRPILGPSLRVFGVALWSYVVFGQFTTTSMRGSAPLGEPAAASLVFLCTAAAWILALRRSLLVPVRSRTTLVARGLGIAFVAFGWWLLVVALATIAGLASGKDLDSLLTFVLMLVSGLAVIQGRRMTLRGCRPPTKPGRTMVSAILWTSAVVTTLGACAEIAAGN